MAKTRTLPSLRDVINIAQYFDEVQSRGHFIKRYKEKVETISDPNQKALACADLIAFTEQLTEFTKHNNHELLLQIHKFLQASIISVDGIFSTLLNEDMIEDDSISKLVPIIYMLTQDKRRDERIKKEFDATFKRLGSAKAELSSMVPGSRDEADILDKISRLEKRLYIVEGEEARIEWQRAHYLKHVKYKFSYAEESNLAQYVSQMVKKDAEAKVDQFKLMFPSISQQEAETLVQTCISANFKLASFIVELFGHIKESCDQKAKTKTKLDFHTKLAEWVALNNTFKKSFSDLSYQLRLYFAIESSPVETQATSMTAKEEWRKSQRTSRLSAIQGQASQALLATKDNVRASVESLDLDALVKSWEDMRLSDSPEPEPKRNLQHSRSSKMFSVAVPSSSYAKATTSANGANAPVVSANTTDAKHKPASIKKGPFKKSSSTFFGVSKAAKSDPDTKSNATPSTK